MEIPTFNYNILNNPFMNRDSSSPTVDRQPNDSTNKLSQPTDYPLDTKEVSTDTVDREGLSDLKSDQLEVVEKLIEDFTGKDVEIVDVSKFNFLHKENTLFKEDMQFINHTGLNNSQSLYKYHTFYKDVDKVKLDMELTVVTSDGQKLDVDIEMNLSQKFIQKTNFNLKSKENKNNNLLAMRSNSKTILKTNLFFEMDVTPITNVSTITNQKTNNHEIIASEEENTPLEPEQNQQVIAEQNNSSRSPTKVDDQNNTQENTNMSKETNKTNLQQSNNNANTSTNKMQETVNTDTLNSLLDFFHVWALNTHGSMELLALGLITNEKIYLTPANQQNTNPNNVTKTNSDTKDRGDININA